MEVGKVAPEGVQGQDLAFQPVRQPILVGLVLHHPEQDFAQEQSDGILVDIAPDAVQRGHAHEITGPPEVRLRILRHLGFKYIQWQEKRHCRLGTHTHEESSPSELLAESVQDDGILPELGVVKDYELSLCPHRPCGLKTDRQPLRGGPSLGGKSHSSAPR